MISAGERAGLASVVLRPHGADAERTEMTDMEKLGPKDHAEEMAIFRSEIIGALTRRELDHGELAAALVELAEKRYRPPGAHGTRQRMRLRWQAERPGALWHGDVCHGAAITVGGTSKPVRIHGLLDDASRYIIALEAHHTEREVDMLGMMVRAIRRHGPPDALYL